MNAAMSMGMNCVGYDPMLTVDAALSLPHQMNRARDIQTLLKLSDYVSLHVPYVVSVRARMSPHSLI